MKTLTFLLALFLAFPAQAHEDWIIRTDAGDDGTVIQIDRSEIDVFSVTDFNDAALFLGNNYTRTVLPNGGTIGTHFNGQTISCEPFANGIVNGKINGLPSVPLKTVNQYRTAGVVFTYKWRLGAAVNPGFFGEFRSGNQSFAPSATQCAGSNNPYALSGIPWAMKFPEPRTAFTVSFAVVTTVFPTRVHFLFYTADGILKGHRDMTGTEQDLRKIIISIGSSVPIAGFAMYTEDGKQKGEAYSYDGGFTIWQVDEGNWISPEPPSGAQCQADYDAFIAQQDDDLSAFVASQQAQGCP